jgi:lysophospholipase L1-like esterase
MQLGTLARVRSVFGAGALALAAVACEEAEPLPPSPADSLCRLHGAEVGIIGDSYINFTPFTSQLEGKARAAGALAASDGYVDHSLGGASMNGFLSIPAQWPDALADARARGASKIRLTIMTGGGNDVLVDNRDCLEYASEAALPQSCKQVVEAAIDSGHALMQEMARDGVEEVIYFFYPHLPEFSLGGGSYPNVVLDYAYPRVKQLCDSQTQVTCHFIDLRPAFDDGRGYPREGLIEFDGIHPTEQGSEIIAQQVWSVMQRECLGSQRF